MAEESDGALLDGLKLCPVDGREGVVVDVEECVDEACRPSDLLAGDVARHRSPLTCV